MIKAGLIPRSMRINQLRREFNLAYDKYIGKGFHCEIVDYPEPVMKVWKELQAVKAQKNPESPEEHDKKFDRWLYIVMKLMRMSMRIDLFRKYLEELHYDPHDSFMEGKSPTEFANFVKSIEGTLPSRT